MDKVDFRLPNEWVAKPDEILNIPPEYIKELQFHIHVFHPKHDFTFRCRDFKAKKGKPWMFEGVIMDSSKRNSLDEITLKRFTYFPVVSLVNVGFMVLPAPEGEEES